MKFFARDMNDDLDYNIYYRNLFAFQGKSIWIGKSTPTAQLVSFIPRQTGIWTFQFMVKWSKGEFSLDLTKIKGFGNYRMNGKIYNNDNACGVITVNENNRILLIKDINNKFEVFAERYNVVGE